MEIKKHILETIVWFDLFDRPLTLEETHDYLIGQKCELGLVRKNIRKMIGKELGRKGNLYFLKDRDSLIDTYKKRQALSKKKLKKAKRVISLLRVFPYIKAIAITQNLAINNAKETSDVDLLIVTKENRIWLSRFFVNIFLDVFRLRSKKSKLIICPNFFISEKHLSIKEVSEKEDVYLAFWVRTLLPVFGAGVFNDFQWENKWARLYMPNKKVEYKNRLVKNPFYYLIKKVKQLALFLFANWLEKKLKNKQLDIIGKNKQKAKNPSITTNDYMIKVHYDDKRTYYRNDWQERLKSLT